MPVPEARCYLFILNPHAGGNSKAGWRTSIETYFQSLPHTLHFYETTGHNDTASILGLIAKCKPQCLVAVGGDGTLKTVAEIAFRQKLLCGLLPAGSANGMAAELGIPDVPEQALEIIAGHHITTIDALRVNGHFSIHLSDVGLNAQLIAYFEETPHRGLWGYAREVLKTLRAGRTFIAKVFVDGKYLRRRAAMIVVANGRTYGTGVVINEQGSLTDGLFEVIVLRHVTLWRILHSLIYRKATPGPHHLVMAGKKLTLKLTRRMPFQVDGEFLGHTRTIEVEMLPGCVQMLTPAPAQES